MKNQDSKKKQSENSKAYLKYSGMGFQMIATILIGVLLGVFLDNKFNTQSIFTAICSLLFVVLSLYVVLKEFIKK